MTKELEYLLETMPLSDRANYPVKVFQGFADHARFLRENVAWCKELPEDIYLNYVLYHRVNDEQIEDCRRIFYERIWPVMERIQAQAAEENWSEEKLLEECILAVNYWCLSEATYRSTDDRTVSPMTVLRCGFGRCGEESVFAVTALRSVGIPARQVYAPKWAHCDDNHAWVEVYCDGEWHYLGACEPEEMLDRGWFMAAASRAMLVHSRTFSVDNVDESAISREGCVYYWNQLGRYGDVVQLQVTVKEKGQTGKDVPVPGVTILAEVLNYGELVPIAQLVTDESGQAKLAVGQGSLHLHCVKDGRFLRAFVGQEELRDLVSDQVLELELDFGRASLLEPEARDGFDFDMIPPADNMKYNKGQPEEVRMRRQRKFDEASAHRREKEAGLQSGTYGNEAEVLSFMEASDHRELRQALVETLNAKDLYDVKQDVLEDALDGALAFEADVPERFSWEIFEKYLLCPRIGMEPLTCWRKELVAYFSEEEKAEFCQDPKAIGRWIKEQIIYEPEREYDSSITTPAALMKVRSGSPKSQDILFVAICRSFGIPARLNPEDGRPEYWNLDANTFLDGMPKKGKEEAPVSFVLISPKEETWIYRTNWTLARLEEGRYQTLDLSGSQWENGQLELQLSPGSYRLITSRRMPTGAQFAREYRFQVRGDQDNHILHISTRETRLADLLSEKPIPDFPLYEADGSAVSLSEITGGQASLLLWLEENQEPTEHILNELREVPAQIIFVLRNPEVRKNPHIAQVLDQMPEIRVLYDDFRDNMAMLARRMYVDPESLPLAVVCKEGLTGVYASAGYQVGLGDLLEELFTEINL